MDEMIRVRGLTRHYGELVAVDHIDFEVHRGEIFGFLGPNGAGKTTTIRMLTGVIDPTEGSASIDGHDIRTKAIAARRHLGILPEDANVYVDLTVWQNVMLMGELLGAGRRERRLRGEELLETFGLQDRRAQKGRALSKGLRQRLMVCMALIGDPDLLFLDEPTSGLDVASARLIRQIVAERNRRGLTVFLTTHNMGEAEELCDRVAIIDHGKIAAIDTTEGLMRVARSRQSVDVEFAGESPPAAELEAIPDVTAVKRDASRYVLYSEQPGQVAQQIATLATERGYDIAAISTRKPSLEDVYLFLTESNGSP
ncbi:ABC transporter ATP-binding protein [candidate division TA06 bacterium SM23_40]|jgi:ABC-2 type transport system ATP-binding protein|uniref:ABC transporter ATP-binding protein n=1 Tax=candidate division TA06 bacterium SM23_40 TaxID=1703774 RepID=A0A0S8GD63_UNCT6|nr:MAG: ABC transporter ATP-binding protein [candidate division TA06 bacterium SM23_40]